MGVGVEYRLLIERPGLHPAHAFLVTEDKEYIERRLRQERDRYRTWEPSTRIWMEQREVAAWTAVDAVSGRFAVSPYELPYGHPLRRDEAEDMEALREELEVVRSAVRDFLDGAPLNEFGRFVNPRYETLYRAAGLDS